MDESAFFKFVKEEVANDNQNFRAVIIKELIESSFNDDIKSGKKRPYFATPPILENEKMYEKLEIANAEISGFDVNEAVNSVKESMKPHVSVNETLFSLTLEVSAESLPEILTICNKILE